MQEQNNITNSLAHTKWNCKYHIVFAPKYRRKVFFEDKRLEIRDILRKLCEWKGVEIIEGEICPDHVHLLVSIPPKMSVAGFMGYLKGKSSLMIFQKWGNMKFAYRNREFWCKGYYVDTFTYSDEKHTEDSFRKKLLCCLGHFHTRKGWKYMGVWERAPKTKRLHFHGLLYVPEGTMPGELFEKRDYNLNTRRMQTTIQNTYFNERFGRCDFESVVRVPMMYDRAVGYILKYIEKTGERLVYSRGTPMYLLTDVEEKDVLTRMGEENRKLLLVDNFECWDGDKYLGRVNEGGKERAKKGN